MSAPRVSVRPGPSPRPGAAGVRPPVQRLASLKNPRSTPVAIPIKQPQAKPTPTTHPPSTTICPNPGCPAPEIVEDDGQKVCAGCGTVISESNIVSEVTFGETSSGAAIVQGTYVGADQSHGRSSGPGFQRGGGIESREITEANGNRYIQQLARALMIPDSATKAAGQVFKLAVGLNFIQGRRTKIVASVCLYVACRRQDGNTVMLIDFADLLMTNVFKLGRMYKHLLEDLSVGGNVFIMNPIDPESLIYRFAKQLEFGEATMRVCGEAIRIVQRMNRDWMITGRRPAGVCGAALILAARMNNFRRTVREVVYVVKVTEMTIINRLNEFSSTESGDLTVDQFRSVQLENSHDPPAFTQAREGKKSRRVKKQNAAETAADIDDDFSSDSASEASSPPPQQPRRIDADGFAIPDIPIDPALTVPSGVSSSTAQSHSEVADEGVPKTGRGRPKGSKNPKPLPPTEQDLAIEAELENEMTTLLASDSNMIVSANRPHTTETNQAAVAENSAVSTADDGTSSAQQKERKPVSNEEEINDSEFESDPEVANCLLSPAEVDLKERIWVTENKDYLRAQQAKVLKRALLEEGGGGRIGKPRKRRKGRLGDVKYLEGDGEGSSRASTPAEATKLMLEQRGYSKKINYRLLEGLWGKDAAGAPTIKESHSTSRSRSRSQSVVSNASTTTGTDRRRRRSIVVESDATMRRAARRAASRGLTPGATPVSVPQVQQPTPPVTQFAPPRVAVSKPTSVSAARGTAAAPTAAKATEENVEIVGDITGFENDGDDAEDPVGLPAGNDEDGDDYDDDDEEEEEEYDVDAAFRGDYGDDGYDYGDDDD